MGAYRFCIYWQIQLGFTIGYEYGFLVLNIPFIKIMFNIKKGAKGTNF